MLNGCFSITMIERRLARVHRGCRLWPAGAQCLYYPVCITFAINVHHLTCAHAHWDTHLSHPLLEPLNQAVKVKRCPEERRKYMWWIWARGAAQNTVYQVLWLLNKVNNLIFWLSFFLVNKSVIRQIPLRSGEHVSPHWGFYPEPFHTYV